MTDMDTKTFALQKIKEYFEEAHPGRIVYAEYLEFHEYHLVCMALAEEPANLMATNFLAGRKDGRATAMKLIESNLHVGDDGHARTAVKNKIQGAIPFPVIDVYEDKP